MTAIGRALMSRPKMILLDEPSLGLAPQLVEEIFAIVDRLNKAEKVGFLVAEQNTNIALRYADYGYILENGRVVMDGAAADLRANEDVKEFYLGLSATGERAIARSSIIAGASAGSPEFPAITAVVGRKSGAHSADLRHGRSPSMIHNQENVVRTNRWRNALRFSALRSLFISGSDAIARSRKPASSRTEKSNKNIIRRRVCA